MLQSSAAIRIYHLNWWFEEVYKFQGIHIKHVKCCLKQADRMPLRLSIPFLLLILTSIIYI